MDDLDGNDKKETNMHLLVAADQYGMERLKLMCESTLRKELDAESVATILALADQHSCSGLKDACIRFIASCTKTNDVVTSRGYNQLKRTCPDTVMEMWEKASRLRKN
jgi:speckle-type POZ protein